MLGRLLRIVVGFAVACFAAGLTMVLFVDTPVELAGTPAEVASTRLGVVLQMGAYVATQAALFAAPFALVAIVIGEWQHNRGWTLYALSGVLIAVVGFLAQHSTEQASEPTIVNNYAMIAFVTAGFVGGLLYWLASGRKAGGRRREPTLLPAAAIKPSAEETPLAAAASPPDSANPSDTRPKQGAAATQGNGEKQA